MISCPLVSIVGRACVATGDDHAPDGAGCMGFVFLWSGLSHGDR